MSQVNFSISKFRILLTSIGAAITLIYYLFHIEGITASYLSTATSLLALFLVLLGVRSVIIALGGGLKKLGFQFIFCGIICSITGLLLWAIFMLTGSPDKANSIPPFLYSSTYFLNFIGFLIIAFASQVKIRDFLGIIVGFISLGLILFTLVNTSHSLTPGLLSSWFLLGDSLRIIIVALLLQMVIVYQGGLLGRYWLSIFVGNIFILIGNFASNILFKEYFSGLWPYSLIDLIFIGGYLYVAHGFNGIGDGIGIAQKKITEHTKKTKRV